MLKEQRIKYQLTQEQLSEMIFVSRKTISNWETEKTTPDIDSLIRLAKLFHFSLDNLLLEGSDVVENIKKQAELKSTKIYLWCSFITNLAFIFIIGSQPFFGELALPVLIVLAIATFSNVLVIFYLSGKLFRLNGYEKMSDVPKKERYISLTCGILFGLVVLMIVFYVRFLY